MVAVIFGSFSSCQCSNLYRAEGTEHVVSVVCLILGFTVPYITCPRVFETFRHPFSDVLALCFSGACHELAQGGEGEVLVAAMPVHTVVCSPPPPPQEEWEGKE